MLESDCNTSAAYDCVGFSPNPASIRENMRVNIVSRNPGRVVERFDLLKLNGIDLEWNFSARFDPTDCNGKRIKQESHGVGEWIVATNLLSIDGFLDGWLLAEAERSSRLH